MFFLFSNTGEAAPLFVCQGVPHIWISQSKLPQRWRHHHTGHVSAFSFFFYSRMNSWIIRSWIWVSSMDVNLKIGVSNVRHCLCFRFVRLGKSNSCQVHKPQIIKQIPSFLLWYLWFRHSSCSAESQWAHNSGVNYYSKFTSEQC